MICIPVTEETEKYMFNYFKCVLDNESHSPSELLDYAKAYVRTYEFQHNTDLPEIKD